MADSREAYITFQFSNRNVLLILHDALSWLELGRQHLLESAVITTLRHPLGRSRCLTMFARHAWIPRLFILANAVREGDPERKFAPRWRICESATRNPCTVYLRPARTSATG